VSDASELTVKKIVDAITVSFLLPASGIEKPEHLNLPVVSVRHQAIDDEVPGRLQFIEVTSDVTYVYQYVVRIRDSHLSRPRKNDIATQSEKRQLR
jgi:hypothetical protein